MNKNNIKTINMSLDITLSRKYHISYDNKQTFEEKYEHVHHDVRHRDGFERYKIIFAALDLYHALILFIEIASTSCIDESLSS